MSNISLHFIYSIFNFSHKCSLFQYVFLINFVDIACQSINQSMNQLINLFVCSFYTYFHLIPTLLIAMFCFISESNLLLHIMELNSNLSCIYKLPGCGAFCAVTQGNRNSKDRLLRLKYTPKGPDTTNSTQFPHTGVTITAAAGADSGGMSIGGGALSALRPVVLVGKGVCYDTGGGYLVKMRYKGRRRYLIAMVNSIFLPVLSWLLSLHLLSFSLSFASSQESFP